MDNYTYYQNNFNNPEKKRTKKRLLRWGIILLPVFLVIYFAFGSYGISINNTKLLGSVGNTEQDKTKELQDAQEQEEKNNPIPSQESERFDVLILGIRGEDDLEDGGLLTDTILVLSIDKKTGVASLVSIPRDLTVNMRGVRGKINKAYEIGFVHNQGLALASEVVSRLTGVYIDKAVVFDFNAFGEIIDALGGIDIYLDKPFSETGQWGYTFSLPAGPNHLDKEQALYYARSRYSSSDFDRAKRQQQLISAIKEKIFDLELLTQPSRVNNIIDSIKNHMRTNFQLWDISNAIDIARAFSNSSLKQYVLNTDNVLYQTKTTEGEYILKTKSGDYDDIQRVFKTILTGTVPTFTPLPSISNVKKP